MPYPDAITVSRTFRLVGVPNAPAILDGRAPSLAAQGLRIGEPTP